MNKKIKNILILAIGIIIGSSACVIGSNVITASQVGINSSKTDKTNIQDAIDELYKKINKPQNTSSVWQSKGVIATVYLDPTNLSKKCNENNSVSTTGTKTGCMKWYTFKEDDTSYTMILDHNTTAITYYNYDNTNASMGMRSASELTAEKVKTINYNEVGYELKTLVDVNGWKVTPRLITGQEIANITGNTTWTQNGEWFYFDSNSQNLSSIKKSKYAWLYDYTKWCSRCNIADDNSNFAYWTSTAYTGNSNNIWRVGCDGTLNAHVASTSIHDGLRPVITVSKSILDI